MKLIIAAGLAALTGTAQAVPHCVAIEREILKFAGTCTFIGKKGREADSVLITPSKKISSKKAFDILYSTAVMLEIGKMPPKQITVLTDEQALGDSLTAEGEPIRIPNTTKPEIDFKQQVKICKIVNWEAQCKPYR